MTQKKIGMTMEESTWESFGEVIRGIDGRVHPFENNEVTFHPTTQRKILNVNMTCAWGRLLGFAHCSTTVIVFVSHRSCLLWSIQIPENTTNKEAHLTNIAGRHKFCLSGGQCHSGLEFCFLGKGAAGELNTHTAEGTTCFYTGGPIQVTICHSNVSIVLGATVKEKIVNVAIDCW
jgi:hypothetical protein